MEFHGVTQNKKYLNIFVHQFKLVKNIFKFDLKIYKYKIHINSMDSVYDIKDIIINKINDKYSRGTYADFSVILMNKNGYINATKLCQLAKENKPFFEWTKTNISKRFYAAASKESGLDRNKLEYVDNVSSDKKLRGTYVHPLLIPHIASWASEDFGMKVSNIVNKYFVSKEIKKKDEMIRKKDDTIDELKQMLEDFKKESLDKLNEMKHESKKTKKESMAKLDKMEKKADASDKKITKVLKLNKDMARKINVIAHDRVIHTGRKQDINHLILIRNNSKKKTDYEYTVLRTMKSSVCSAIKKHKESFPKMKEILNIDENPNGIMLWKNIKDRLVKQHKIIVSGMNFDINNKYYNNDDSDDDNSDIEYDEDDLIKDFKKIHKERLKTEDD